MVHTPAKYNGHSCEVRLGDPAIATLAKIYGNVFRLYLGTEKTVFVSGYNTVKEALVTQAENFVDRPFTYLGEKIYSGTTGGLFLSNGKIWTRQRRFALTTLHSFGLGKRSMEQSICEESRFLQEEMENEKGKPFNPASLFNNAVSNIICQLVFGKRFDYSDHHFQTMLKCMNEAVQLEGSIWGQLYEAFPGVMKYLPGRHNDIFSYYETIKVFINGEIQRHRQDLNPSCPRDYIDTYLIEMENHKEEPEEGFDEANLVLCSLDMFLAGTETTSMTLQWALIFLIKHPHIQEKVQAEIDSVIGRCRQPTMTDRPNLPYTDAVIHEVQRMGNIVPLNVPRMAAIDTTLGGYFIPKGTSLIPILNSVLFDKTEWESPDTFHPEHFLNDQGKFRKRDAFLPFSAGKRVCLGEGLAKMELFLFFVSLFQKFKFSTLEEDELSAEGIGGTLRKPQPFEIYAKAH
ncbi:cytochrome P450 2J2-like [Aplochiton taeniatus]